MPSRLRSPLTIFRISKGKFQPIQKSFLYLLGRFQEKYQWAKNNSVQLGQNFQNPLPTKLVGSLNPHFCPNWTEVKKPTSTQVVSKSRITSTQLAEKSGFNFYTDCAEVENTAIREAATNLYGWSPLFIMLTADYKLALLFPVYSRQLRSFNIDSKNYCSQ